MKNAASDISFYFEKHCRLSDRQQLKAFILSIFKRYRTRVESLSIVFCSDDYLLEINRQYLQHDYFTDIITFNLGNDGDPVAGEIYISVDRVKENALSVKTSFSHELHRVIFHGVLHLCGLDDKIPAQKLKMSTAENKLLAQYLS